MISTHKVLESCLVKDTGIEGAILQGPESTSKFVYEPFFNLNQVQI